MGVAGEDLTAAPRSPGHGGLGAPRSAARAGGQPGAAGGEGREAGRRHAGREEKRRRRGRERAARAEPPSPFPGRRAPGALSCGGGRWPHGVAAAGAGPGAAGTPSLPRSRGAGKELLR